ncbi:MULTISPECIES: hypothetical protein [Enterococcus]|uniref:hypothetical protein n=1 Tax=Enterococcus TaxID=1350 RepID=UPI000344C61B|nr:MULTISPECIES: hypothetical protein [Enterococcus]MCE3073276.1 hypothetical protein [Enterococcus faecium]MCE3105145.1 hypothetical protein [Enterococcus faecium]MCE3149913.1 hypothetical protein [Enterococcus faecium]MCE3160490.1 hypothetical protein [Enterococcus faecium]MCE3163441.1 hypothetical protein [Enterococcus faecium]
MNDDEVAKLILKEIEMYLQFDILQREYAEKGIKNALKKIKRSDPDSLQTKGST